MYFYSGFFSASKNPFLCMVSSSCLMGPSSYLFVLLRMAWLEQKVLDSRLLYCLGTHPRSINFSHYF
ncbi:hypothetical protein DU71_11720 [Methanosarcina mazei]|uniref:Uncharacterized protein n=1 Tax=Methanosarcina mazei TaxID=2209 RepID=A0A0F8N436_METMZ|nr:hypothetical protein DU71_11720 [Methanosarcina mazei]KKH54947.1 hypothetical protein DU72_06490 [Methanosarcina mazei]